MVVICIRFCNVDLVWCADLGARPGRVFNQWEWLLKQIMYYIQCNEETDADYE